MPSYRFCRSDDIALIADALNACFFVHASPAESMSASDFKREIRELDVWSSSCMVASENRDSIAIITGAKREHETLVHRLGVHPDFMRRGHASHLLDSLCQKLAILGPERIVAEVPDDNPPVRSLFERSGYEPELQLADFSLTTPISSSGLPRAIVRVGLEDLLGSQSIDPRVGRSWERAVETLQNRKDQIDGLAIASGEHVEAFALFRDRPDCKVRELVALGPVAAVPPAESIEVTNPRASRTPIEMVIQAACDAGGRAVTIPRISSEEISWETLARMGFERDRTYTRFGASPSSIDPGKRPA